MFSSDRSTAAHQSVLSRTEFLLNTQKKHRSRRYAFGLSTPWEWCVRTMWCKWIREMWYNYHVSSYEKFDPLSRTLKKVTNKYVLVDSRDIAVARSNVFTSKYQGTLPLVDEYNVS